jgi:ketosteroid isomerase-like protein
MSDRKEPSMNADANVRVVLEVFAAIERRDTARFLAHTHPECTICWPPSLPWNDGIPGRPDKDGHHARSWLEVWTSLQPTAAERQMHPEVIAAADDRVVVRWRQRGCSPTGLCFDGQMLGLYQVRQERLARAQMFYFDTDAANRFLADATGQRPPSPPSKPPTAGR